MRRAAVPHAPTPHDAILTNLVGVTFDDLDIDQPADLMLREITKRYVRAREEVNQCATGIIREMHEAQDADNHHPSLLAESSHSHRYDQAIATLRALNELLGAAAYAYKLAHPGD
jgi:hypothetical protein